LRRQAEARKNLAEENPFWPYCHKIVSAPCIVTRLGERRFPSAFACKKPPGNAAPGAIDADPRQR
jgi:hypothetical protein